MEGHSSCVATCEHFVTRCVLHTDCCSCAGCNHYLSFVLKIHTSCFMLVMFARQRRNILNTFSASSCVNIETDTVFKKLYRAKEFS